MGWWTKWRYGAVCADYKALLDRFLDHAISIETLQSLYFERFKNETRSMNEALFQVLDEVFAYLDGYTSDPALLAEKPNYFVGEAQLRERVQAASSRLESFIGS
jgi:hypothetical protein